MRPLDFIETARDLADANRQDQPRETNLRRAVSTTYYALFHCLASCCADTIAGDSPANRDPLAWNQAYRALEHRTALNRCKEKDEIKRFSTEIEEFAKLLVALQLKRHSADYDPNARFYKNQVIQDIHAAENVIRCFTEASLKDRRAFVAYVLLPIRKEEKRKTSR